MNGDKTYLDEQGNPVQGKKVYLDENGSPIQESDELSPEIEARKQQNMVAAGLSPEGKSIPPSVQIPFLPYRTPTSSLSDPFSTIGNAVGAPVLGQTLNSALMFIPHSLSSATENFASVPSSPDVPTGILRASRGLGDVAMAGLGALHPAGFSEFGAATGGLSAANPDIGSVIQGLGSPIQSLTNPQTPFGKELAQTGDVAAQLGVAALASNPKLTERPRQAVADALSQSAYKIPTGVKSDIRGELLHTAQEYNITPRIKGVEKIDARLGELREAQKTLEDNAVQSQTGRIPVADVVASIDPLIEKWSKSDTPKDFIRVLQNYKDKVTNQQQPDLSVQDMMDLKRNLQGQLSQVYNKAMKLNPNIQQNLLRDAKSAVELNVRKRLEDIIPGYADVNSRMHKLLNLKPYVEQAANRISNQDLASIRLKDILFGGAVGFSTHNPIEAAAAIATGRIMTDPRIQASLANKISPQVNTPFQMPKTESPWPTYEPGKGRESNLSRPEAKGVQMIPNHQAFIEAAGGKYMGTNSVGSIFYDDASGSTGLIPKGTSLEDAKKMIAASNKRNGK